MNNGHTPIAIANKILEISKEKQIEVSMMKLIKLTYFAHGWFLGLTGKPLSSEPAEAWQYGPVFRSLYQAMPYTGSMIITQPIRSLPDRRIITSNFDDNETKLMERIVDIYGVLGAFQLSDITHEVGSPWHTTIQSTGKFSIISDADIAQHFSEKRITA